MPLTLLDFVFLLDFDYHKAKNITNNVELNEDMLKYLIRTHLNKRNTEADEYIRKCLNLLDLESGASVVYCRVFVDLDNNEISKYLSKYFI